MQPGTAPWSAPLASAPVDALVRLPGSKSLTNRALVLAALADRPSTIRRALRARDTLLMADGLRAMGVGILPVGPDWRVVPAALTGQSTVDVGNAGTVMRFLPPVACLAEGPVAFDGDPRSYERPLRPLLDALRALGAEVDDGGRGALPLTVRGKGGLAGGAVELDASLSSQLVSALLLAGARFETGVTVRHVGGPVPSTPHLAMTVQALREAGVAVDDGVADVWSVRPGPIRAADREIEPDLSNAAPFLAAAVVTAGRVSVAGWPARTTQPGDALRGLCAALGADVRLDERGLTVRGAGRIHGVDLDLRDAAELVPTLAAVAVLADSPSRLRGIAHIRAHETDRLAALARELSGLGADVRETADGLTIDPKPLSGGLFRTYDDHRLATAAAVLGLVVPGVTVENVGTTAKTMPDFPTRWLAMLGGPR